MLKINESDYPNVVYMEVDGGITKEDTENAESFIKEHYGDSAEINALAYFKKLEDVDADAMLQGMFIDAKHWNQYNKIALVADDDWLQNSASVADILPGIKVKQHNKSEIDEAWDWVAE